MPAPHERLPLPHDVRHSLLANDPHRGYVRAFRDTTVRINIQGALAILPWIPMMVGTLAT
jgi:hypothetical protein